MRNEEDIICCKCNVTMKPRKTEFSYVGHTFVGDLPRCEVCGQVYVSQEFVEKKIRSLEMEFEDK